MYQLIAFHVIFSLMLSYINLDKVPTDQLVNSDNTDKADYAAWLYTDLHISLNACF